MGKIVIFNNKSENQGVDTSIVTASATDVLINKIIVDKDGNPLVGTMKNNGAINQSLNCGDSYTIPEGYHNGNGLITANSLASQTSATATATQILNGYTAYINGNKITGTMTNNGAVTPTALGAGGSYTIPVGYHNGSGKVTAQSLATMTSSGDATAAQILVNKKAYVDGSLITGTMTNRGAQTKTFTPSASKQTYTIPAGYHNGSGVVTCNAVSNLTAANIKKGVTVGGVTGTWSGYTGDLVLYDNGTNNGLTMVKGTLGSNVINASGSMVNICKYLQAINVTPYSKLNITFTVTSASQPYVMISVGTKLGDNYVSWEKMMGKIVSAKKLNVSRTESFSLSTDFKSYPSPVYFESESVSGSSGSGTVGNATIAISKIWFSV